MRFLLLALTAHAALAFAPASPATSFRTSLSQSSMAAADDAFDGIDLEQLLGSKKFKKQEKKFKRMGKNRVKAAEALAQKQERRSTHLQATSGGDGDAAGLKLLIW